jgi:hypothetical protein
MAFYEQIQNLFKENAFFIEYLIGCDFVVGKKHLIEKESNGFKIQEGEFTEGSNQSSNNKGSNSNAKHAQKHSQNNKKLFNMLELTPLNIAFVLALLFIMCALAFGITDGFNFSKYKSNFNGVGYNSDYFYVSELTKVLADYNTLIISPRFLSTSNQDNISAMTLWQIAFAKGDSLPIQLWRVYNVSGTLDSCQTNFGNVRESKNISKTECEALLNSSGKFLILLDESNAGFNLNSNKLTAFPKYFQLNFERGKATRVSYEILMKIVPDFNSTLKKYNLTFNLVSDSLSTDLNKTDLKK